MIGLVGASQHGKNTVADILTEKFGFKQIAFADQLRAFLLAQNPIVRTTRYRNLHLKQLIDEIGWDRAKTEESEVRRLLQKTATEAARKIFGDDCWIEAATLHLLSIIAANDGVSAKVCFTDVRFPNEFENVKNSPGGLMIGIIRPNFDNGVGQDHESEKHIPELLKQCHYVLVNDDTLEKFQEDSSWCLEQILAIHTNGYLDATKPPEQEAVERQLELASSKT